MLLSLRETFVVRRGQIGFGALMALTARPPFRNNWKRHDDAIGIMRQWALSRYRRDFGTDHPQYGRATGKKGLSHHEARLNHLFLDLEKGVDAGRLFLSSLAAHDPAQLKAGEGKITFSIEGKRSELTFPAVHHKNSIAALFAEREAKLAYEKTDSRNVRQDRWDKWGSVIHIAAAFAITIDAHERMYGSRPWIARCKSMLADTEADHAEVIATIANGLLQKAEDCRIFPKNNPRPIELID